MVAAGALAQDDQFDFMPPGGRALLLDLLGQVDAETLAETAARDAERRGLASLGDVAGSRAGRQVTRDIRRLRGTELPRSAKTFCQRLAGSGDATLLPPDGKDLAIAQCQFCHSLFSGYLMQDRDETGWKGTFKSPFHSEIPMTEVERDTFANYSAAQHAAEIRGRATRTAVLTPAATERDTR